MIGKKLTGQNNVSIVKKKLILPNKEVHNGILY